MKPTSGFTIGNKKRPRVNVAFSLNAMGDVLPAFGNFLLHEREAIFGKL